MILLVGLYAITSCKREEYLTKDVDVFIGTDGEGHTFPGATMPFGMVQLSPDTRISGGSSCGGFYFSDLVILKDYLIRAVRILPPVAGFHSIQIRYFQCGGGNSLKFSWQGPGFSKQEVTPEALFHQNHNKP
ncbi:MAG: hypothetical protein J7K46_03860 [Bacteroidales bacterium]|nr:hypothetical protein [Bacteroidales bacterium]